MSDLPEVLELKPLAAVTASGNGATTPVKGHVGYVVVCRFTDKAADADDTCDVYVDFSLDGTNWYNAIHFTQALGNGTDAQVLLANLLIGPAGSPTAGVSDVVDVTSDAASGKVRDYVCGAYMRARWVIVDSGDADQTFTFSVRAFAI